MDGKVQLAAFAHLARDFHATKIVAIGLCVEPNKNYHDDLRKHRSCTLVPQCLSDTVNSSLKMSHDGVRSQVQETRTKSMWGLMFSGFSGMLGGGGGMGAPDIRTVQCNPLHEMLRGVGRTHVDVHRHCLPPPS